MEINCDQCGIVFKRKPSEINKTNNFCNRICLSNFRKTENLDSKRIKKFITTTWGNLNLRCGKYKHLQTEAQLKKNKCYKDIEIKFSREEFKDWVIENTDVLFSLKRPSIDRINSTKHYSLDNIRLIELQYNISLSSNGSRYINGDLSKVKRGIKKAKNNSYYARITINRKETHLGTFKTKEEAYSAFYNKYLEYYGFPPWETGSN